MGLNDTPSGERVQIGFFGCTNAGKSSLVNAFTNQNLSVVSSIKGTTTDPVQKAMELLPVGPVMIIDTAGYDDSGELGEKRIAATQKILRKCDLAILVSEAVRDINNTEKELISLFKQREMPYLIVKNKCDLLQTPAANSKNIIYTSAQNGYGIENLKNAAADLAKKRNSKRRIIGDFINRNDIAVLVTPIDDAAPKGRLILPQQQTIRDIIESDGVAVVTKENTLAQTLNNLARKPAVVITDSQVFKYVNETVPDDIPLTSFSILMARYKGFLKTAVKGAQQIEKLKHGSCVLISEGCTHHRQCDDIGTVKLPAMLKNYTNAELDFEWSSGIGFPDDLKKYDLIIHCGACMLNENEMKYRMTLAENLGIAFTNYGTAIAYMQGILERSLEPLHGTY